MIFRFFCGIHDPWKPTIKRIVYRGIDEINLKFHVFFVQKTIYVMIDLDGKLEECPKKNIPFTPVGFPPFDIFP